MEDPYCCPNIDTCKLVNTPGFIKDKKKQGNYIQLYCRADESKWNSCKRVIAKNELHFCPDFVLPDTSLSIDEIIDKFDNEQIN